MTHYTSPPKNLTPPKQRPTPQPEPAAPLSFGEALEQMAMGVLRQGPMAFDHLYRKIAELSRTSPDPTTLRLVLESDRFEVIGKVDVGRPEFASVFDLRGGDSERRRRFFLYFIPNEQGLADDVAGWVRSFGQDPQGQPVTFSSREVAAELVAHEVHVRRLLDRLVSAGALAHRIEPGRQPLYRIAPPAPSPNHIPDPTLPHI
jgi:hypothetical protein